jgi:hypothetical protein
MKCGRGDVLKAVLDALREELRKHDYYSRRQAFQASTPFIS